MTPPAPENSQIRLGSATVIALPPSPHNARDIAPQASVRRFLLAA